MERNLTLEPYTLLVKTQSEAKALSIAAMRALRKGHSVRTEIVEVTDKGIIVRAIPR